MLRHQKARPLWHGAIMGLVAMSIASFCNAESVRVFPEPWQVLEPGKPVEKPLKIEIVAKGEGAIIEQGDLVQIIKKSWSIDQNEYINEKDWWLWIGFRTQQETTFFTDEPRIRSALLGINEGTSLKFVEAKGNWVSAGKLRSNPLGDPADYSWRKNVRSFSEVYIPSKSGYSLIEIKRVCKGKAQYRTVRLFDDSSVERCTWAPIHCEMSNTPREGWIDEAMIEAVCQDGKTATFQYGPVASRNGKEWSGPINPANYFAPWINAAWNKLPVGVQLK